MNPVSKETERWITELFKLGKTPKYISEVTGLKLQTVYLVTRKLRKPDLKENSMNTKLLNFSFDFREEWLKAVNRIRKYYNLPIMR